MAVFAAASAVVIPLAAGLLSDRELVRAGDQVRGELTRLRVHAVREGRVMTLQCNPESGELRVVPMFSSNDAIESAGGSGAPSALLSGADQAMGVIVPTDDASAEGWTIELPEGIVVRGVVSSAVGGASAVEASLLNRSTPMDSGATDGESSTDESFTGELPMVYFYPTGQTSNAIITFGNAAASMSAERRAGLSEDANVVRVQVRGLTGDVTLRGNL